jgi:TPR repeat protein
MKSDENQDIYRDAQHFLKSGESAKAFLIYKKLAGEGDVQAKVYLGWMYDQGIGTEKNPEMAYELFRSAATLGSIEGSFFCGKHLLGKNLLQEALRQFQVPALSSYGPALLWVGLMHVKGLGVPPNISKGLMALRQSAKTGNFAARRELSLLMIKGALGVFYIPYGVVYFLYSVISALITGLIDVESDKFMG